MSDQAVGADVGNAIVTTFSCGKSGGADVGAWLVKSMMQASEAPGFVSGEITPPKGATDIDWTLVQRFRSSAEATAWKQSETRKKYLADLQTAHNQEQLHISEEDQVSELVTVTTAIMTHIKPGMEDAYRGWEGKVQEAQTRSPGYRGSYFQPDTGEAGVWVSLMRFDNAESLDKWFTSPARLQLLEDAKALVTSTDIQRVTGSFPGWIPIDPKTGKGPPNWKAFLLVLLGLYPIVTLEIRYLGPMLAGHIPTAPMNLICNGISVAATTWITMPLFIKWFAPFMFPPEGAKPADTIKWVGIIAAGFIAELAILWKLL